VATTILADERSPLPYTRRHHLKRISYSGRAAEKNKTDFPSTRPRKHTHPYIYMYTMYIISRSYGFQSTRRVVRAYTSLRLVYRTVISARGGRRGAREIDERTNGFFLFSETILRKYRHVINSNSRRRTDDGNIGGRSFVVSGGCGGETSLPGRT